MALSFLSSGPWKIGVTASLALGGAWVIFATAPGCTAQGGNQWVRDGSLEATRPPDRGWSAEPRPSAEPRGAAELDQIPMNTRPDDEGLGSEPSYIDAPSRTPAPPAARETADPELYRNTYYDFPREDAGAKEVSLFDAACVPLARVTRAFHDRVCVQGSGRLEGGATVSFAKRGCSCAAVCPRTSQQICFERLDPARFPNGRGATGRPITPLRTLAVDSAVIPLGTVAYVPELAGLPNADGSPHDGCFIAEDRGLRVTGRQIDVFTGDPSMTARWNALFPSNRGVHVRLGDARCRALGPR